MTASTTHRLTPSHLTVLEALRPHTGRQEHLLTAPSQRGRGTDAATPPPSAGPDEAAVSAAAWLLVDQMQSYSSQATLATDSPHDQSTDTHRINSLILI